ncbi:phage tail protein [Rugamonas apoptosis]|uniref:Phage tail protein n=1 Tax=Rugamonas apoptosis TaxID=2758570 RepID=A0A7W2F5F1_9BURK|nr:tail fiber protein [Rugamonas apoptosis]MBA5685480.1 phage tail protein [Rugamonas apoptosis]
MAEPFVGEIRMFGGNFAPQGWAFCDGNLMPISENEALFALLGTTYGGDGETTFALPDLRGRVPIHQGSQDGNSYVLGQQGGSEEVTLMQNQVPAHTHLVGASAAVPPATGAGINVTSGVPYVPASPGAKPKLYAGPGMPAPMYPGAVAASGGSQPHNNMAPFLGVHFIISLFGIFPSQS